MALRDSWAVQASGPAGLLDVEEARVALGALWMPGASTTTAKSGFRPGPGTSPGLVSATGTPDANVHVSPFQLVLQTARAGTGGPYIITMDAIADVNILSTPADGTNPRNDLVIAQQSDTFYGDGVSTWAIRQVVGTPAGVPADPSVSGSTDYVPLARVRVNAGATTITSGNITDLRSGGHAKSLTGSLYTTTVGGLIPVASAAGRDALTGVYDGLSVWRTDLHRAEVHNGTAYVATGGEIVQSWKAVPTGGLNFTTEFDVLSNSWTPPAVGCYLIKAIIPFDGSAGGTDCKGRIRVGGAETAIDVKVTPGGGFVGWFTLLETIDVTSLSAVTVKTTVEKLSGAATCNTRIGTARTEILTAGQTGIRA
jgi:hypothetical protein